MINKDIIMIAFCFIFILTNIVAAKGTGKGDSKDPNNNTLSGNNNIQINQGLRQEMKDDKDTEKDNKQVKTERDEKNQYRYNLTECINLSEQVRNKNIQIIKSVKKSDEKNIAEQGNKLIKMINNIFKNYEEFMNNTTNEDKLQIKEQTKLIEQSKEKITNILSEMDKESANENKSKEIVLVKTQELGKEMNKLERQFRAIDWLISNE